MNRELQKFLGFAAAVGALVLVVSVLGERFLFNVSGPETAIVTRLKQLEREGLEIVAPVGTLAGGKLQYQRISIALDADGQGALVTSTLDFTGVLKRRDGTETKVSSLGLERARYRLKDDEWQPETNDAPRLLAIIAALDERRVAIDAGAAYAEIQHRRWVSQAWFIRSERDDVEVAEDYRLTGSTPDKPIDEKSTRRLSLREDGAQRFSFPGGIM
ncbi:MAG: hypothetical protein DI536_05545 [Archangium gephyra]|uniref:Uncharacterized protein n=1 Tax=Archangium gephyra TaxID=48 RepID=A0A2W5TTL8_9BACT|nr:MAG: hypothetical protein DI536_05545 [Archangium gephyra]